jgi:exosome complex component CSL4|tara:strand:+ start:2753 stop:3322 length:570 start_codon:yes stop_codon:yes gene_type:complete
MVKNGEFVVPGTEVGFSEEFIPGDGAYEEGSKIYASLSGILVFDMDEKKVMVDAKTSIPSIPQTGDLIIGTVVDVRAQLAIVNIVKIKGNNRGLPGEVRGGIHISKIRNSYVSDIDRELKVGDAIYAKITDREKWPLQLSTADKDLGVIKALCTKCTMPLLQEKDKLKCPNCGSIETRRLSPKYGTGEI